MLVVKIILGLIAAYMVFIFGWIAYAEWLNKKEIEARGGRYESLFGWPPSSKD